MQDDSGNAATQIRAVAHKTSLLHNHRLHLGRQRRSSGVKVDTYGYVEYERLHVYIRGRQHNHFFIYMLVRYLFSFFIPEISLIYATVRIFLVVVRADSQVSAQVQSIRGGANEAGLVTLKAIRSAKNVLIICLVAVAHTVPLFLHMSMRHVFFDVHMSIRHVFFDVHML